MRRSTHVDLQIPQTAAIKRPSKLTVDYQAI